MLKHKISSACKVSFDSTNQTFHPSTRPDFRSCSISSSPPPSFPSPLYLLLSSPLLSSLKLTSLNLFLFPPARLLPPPLFPTHFHHPPLLPCLHSKKPHKALALIVIDGLHHPWQQGSAGLWGKGCQHDPRTTTFCDTIYSIAGKDPKPQAAPDLCNLSYGGVWQHLLDGWVVILYHQQGCAK